MTVLLGLSAGTIRLLMKLDRAGRSARDQAVDLRRLATDFRGDAHAALAEAPRPDGGDRLILTLPGGRTAEYEARPTTIVRTLREGGKVRRNETYRRPRGTTLRFEISPEGPRPIASLAIDASTGEDGLYHGVRVEAELGKDARYSPRGR